MEESLDHKGSNLTWDSENHYSNSNAIYMNLSLSLSLSLSHFFLQKQWPVKMTNG